MHFPGQAVPFFKDGNPLGITRKFLEASVPFDEALFHLLNDPERNAGEAERDCHDQQDSNQRAEGIWEVSCEEGVADRLVDAGTDCGNQDGQPFQDPQAPMARRGRDPWHTGSRVERGNPPTPRIGCRGRSRALP
ncbi:MAG: hypothetical protein EB020_12805 [Proteobacteria bacterium]|nr:hypothetical protein [Pseudomonadota bacterium]